MSRIAGRFTPMVFHIALLLGVLMVTTSALAVDLIVSGSVRITTPTTYDSVVVLSGGTLTVDAAITSTGDMRVASGGVVTHSAYPTNGGAGMRIIVADTLLISGTINVSGRGLRGAGTSGSAFGARGEVYDTAGTTVVAGASGNVGASFGGSAPGTTNLPYGVFESPRHMGSGGSGCNFGGNGGGFAWIDAGTIVLTGTITANGGTGGNCAYGDGGGGGTGGTVRLSCAQLSGAGTISAYGGNYGNSNPTAGGGGRVAIYCDDMTGFATTQVTARGGGSGQTKPASAGTIFIRPSSTDSLVAGELIIDNASISSTAFTQLRTKITQVDRLTLRNLGKLLVPGTVTSLTSLHTVNIGTSSILDIASGAQLSVSESASYDVNVTGAGSLYLRDGSTLNVTSLHVSGSTSTVDISVRLDFTDVGDQFLVESSGYFINRDTLKLPVLSSTTLNGGSLFNLGLIELDDEAVQLNSGARLYENALLTADDTVQSVTIDAGGILSHSGYPTNTGSGLRLGVRDTLRVLGSIDVAGRGLRGAGTNGSAFGSQGEAYNAAGTSIVAGPTGEAGASFGGSATGTTNQPYGVFESPRHFGSGGSGCSYGGNGGGFVWIDAGAIVLTGTITANGGNGGSCVYGGGGGGGTGGTIRLSCGGLTGAGSISAYGGTAGNTNPTAGGGGRVALYCDDMTGFAVTQVVARGGSGSYNPASAGTIFVRPSRTDSLVAGELIIDNASVSSTAYTRLQTAITEIDRLTLRNLGKLNIPNTVTSLTSLHTVNIGTSSILDITSGAQLSVSESASYDVNVTGAGSLYLRDGSTLNVTSLHVSGSTSTVDISVRLDFTDVGDQFLVESSGYFVNRDTLRLPVLNSTTLNGGSLFNLGLIELDDEAVQLNSGARLYENAFLTEDDTVQSLTIDAGGVLSHSGYPTNTGSGLRLGVRDTLRVLGSIDVAGRGLRGAGTNGSAFGSRGEAYDAAGVSIVAGPTGEAGASYGGVAQGTTNSAYGNTELPTHFGSGGSGCNYGGNGGGLVWIDAGAIVLTGTITANGGNGGSCVYGGGGGGGTGGTIRLSCGGLTGAGTISAYGGNGANTNPTAGGGGRVALYCDDMTGFATTQIVARGGSGSYNPASAGTIYICPSRTDAELPGKLIVNNSSVSSTASTPLKTDLSTFGGLLVTLSGKLTVPKHISVLDTTQVATSCTLTLDSGLTQTSGPIYVSGGSIVTGDTIHIEADASLTGTGTVQGQVINLGTIASSGTVQGNVLNSGTIAPGASAGRFTINGNLTMDSTSTLSAEIGGLTPVTQYDKLDVNGHAILDGTLSVSYLNLFEPLLGDSFLVVDYTTHEGLFNDLTGVDTALTGLFYRDNGVVLLTDSSNIVSTQDRIVLSPAGNIPFVVNLRDQAGNPVVGSNDVWLDFAQCPGIVGCPSEPEWPIVRPTGVTGADGNIRFWPRGGGCSEDSVVIYTSHGAIGKVKIRSLDLNGGLSVSAFDFTGGACNDYDDDGSTDWKDWDFLSNYLGQTCVDVPANYTELKVFTVPGPGAIAQGDTIQVCARILNTLGVDIILDSVIFKTAGWGIAMPWTELGRVTSITLEGLDSSTLCFPFLVPPAGHGCFQAHIFPRYSEAVMSAELATASPAEDSVVYGVTTEGSTKWAYIGVSNGQELMAVQFDSTTGIPDYSSARLLGETQAQLEAGVGLDQSASIELLQSDLVGVASSLWTEGFPAFEGTPGELEVLNGLSGDLFYFRGVSQAAADLLAYGKMEPNKCDFSPPVCPPNPEPPTDYCTCSRDGTWRECCAAHDHCYYVGGTQQDKETCDATLAECMMEHGAPYWQARLYYRAVRRYGHGCFGGPPPPGTPPSGKAVQLNVDTRTKTSSTLVAGGLHERKSIRPESCTLFQQEDTVFTFNVPIGNSGGDSLILKIDEFLPDGWKYYLDRLGMMLPPDTISGYVIHDRIVRCQDTGRIVISAYDLSEQYAGYVEIRVQPLGRIGDVDGSTTVDIADLTMLVDYLFTTFALPTILDAADLTQDGQIDISDVTRFVDHLILTLDPLTCDPPPAKSRSATASAAFAANVTFDSSCTSVWISSAQQFKGLEMVLIGPPEAKPVQMAGDKLEMFYGQLDSLLRIGIFDKDGPNLIEAGERKVVRIPGTYRLFSIKGSDVDFNTVAGSVQNVEGPLIPKEFALGQNYPNPFNPITRIEFALPKSIDVELTVFNILGQRVRTVVNRVMEAGYHTIEWDGRNEAGAEVGSGVYFYRLRAGDFVESRKMVLLK